LAVLASTDSRPTGVIIAAPAPCSTRNAVSTTRLTLVEHSSEAIVNTTMADRKTFLVPSRLTSQPLDGMNTARVTSRP
jgi:hypothetical protein